MCVCTHARSNCLPTFISHLLKQSLLLNPEITNSRLPSKLWGSAYCLPTTSAKVTDMRAQTQHLHECWDLGSSCLRGSWHISH